MTLHNVIDGLAIGIFN
jgi:zinc transporter ZupT